MNTLKKKIFRLFEAQAQTPPSPLPSAYQEVEYIQAYGLAYIDTGITSSDTTKIEIECCAIDITPSNQHSRVMLTAGTSASSMIAVYPDITNSVMNIRFGSVWVPSSMTVNIYDKVKLTFDNSSLTVEQNGVSQTDTYTAGTITPDTIYLFRVSYNANYWATGRVYGMKIWDNDTLVRDYIPCYRKSDKELGLYDTVSQTFFANAGYGSFHAKYLDLPSGYKQCEYVDSSAQQGINTGINFTSNHRVDMNCMPIGNASGSVHAFFGSYDGTNNVYLGKGNANTWRVYYAHGASGAQKYYELTQAQYYTLKALCGDRTRTFYMNANISSLVNNTYSSSASAYIFCRHNKTSQQEQLAILSTIRLYNCNIYNNGTKIKTYIPCYRTSDDVAGLYELNEGTFLTSVTGINLIKGADV